jgi:opacity protein-like surface antigen
MKKMILMYILGLCTLPSIAQLTYPSAQYSLASATVLNNSFDDTESAPASSDSRFLIGFRFMPTISSFDVHKVDANTIETSSVVSYGYGGLIGFTVSDNVAFQGEFIYSTYAQKFKDASGEGRVELSYINIPLMLVLNTNYNAPVNLNIAIGPQIGINTGSKLEAGSAGNGTDTIHAVLSVKPADVGFAYGAGLDFGFGPDLTTRLSIGFRGVYGLVDISDNSQSLTTDEFYVLDRSHMKTYSAYIGLTFAF